MLVCKNCFTENADGAVRCHQCNMEGNFEYKVSEGRLKDVIEEERASQQCVNCGHHDPGEGDKCVNCFFPIPANRKTITKDFPSQDFRLFETG